MLVLFETQAGFAIFKLIDENKLTEVENLYQDFETPERASKIVKLKHFEKYADKTEALASTTALLEGKLTKSLRKMLKRVTGDDLQQQLLVADAKLGNAIKDKLNLSCVSNNSVQELMRCIRSQAEGLIAGLPQKEMTAMALGLAHSLSRYKLKFSPDKVDTMIVQAVGLLDDLDKELNNYNMRCREWYGWHFPEMGKIISDPVAYVKAIKIIGTRNHAATSDLSDILPEEIEEQVKEAAEISMGTEISEDDILNIHQLCDKILQFTTYRQHLSDYLRARMLAIAPNLTVLVGEMVGARLISHAGSLINLAKHPASTVQILGAEKALFRALKARKDTPKYGLIYHSSMVTQSSTKFKGKVSRMLATKASLATRVDAFGEEGTNIELGAEHKVKLEAKIRLMEEGFSRRISGTGKAKAKFQKYQTKSEIKQYEPALDVHTGTKRKHDEIEQDTEEAAPKKAKLIEVISETTFNEDENKTEESEKKKKKKKKKSLDNSELEVTQEELVEQQEEGEPKKKKKKKKESLDNSVLEVTLEEPVEQQQQGEPKKKKKKKQSLDGSKQEEEMGESSTPLDESISKKKKKKKKSMDLAS